MCTSCLIDDSSDAWAAVSVVNATVQISLSVEQLASLQDPNSDDFVAFAADFATGDTALCHWNFLWF